MKRWVHDRRESVPSYMVMLSRLDRAIFDILVMVMKNKQHDDALMRIVWTSITHESE